MLLYNLLLNILAIVLIPWYLLRVLLYRQRLRRGVLQRFGFFSARKRNLLANLPPERVLIHAVSVGETRAALPLIKEIFSRTSMRILVSNVTETGNTIARTLDEVDQCLYIPFDFRFAVCRFLDQVKPQKIIIVETEIWPNLIFEAHKRGIPVYIINARISDRSFRRYHRLRWFFGPVLQRVQYIFAQSRKDRLRLIDMGAVRQRVDVAGNIKFDQALADATDIELDHLYEEFRIPREGVKVISWGSLHADEDQVAIRTHQRLLDAGEPVIGIIAPRHPEREDQLAQHLTAAGISFTRRTDLPTRKRRFKPGEVLLVNTIGELLKVYRLSHAVVVGGSFDSTGGHNILEACSLGKPVVYGPNMANFRDIARIVRDWEAGCWVNDEQNLYESLDGIISNPALAQQMGQQGRALLARHRGALQHCFKRIFQDPGNSSED